MPPERKIASTGGDERVARVEDMLADDELAADDERSSDDDYVRQSGEERDRILKSLLPLKLETAKADAANNGLGRGTEAWVEFQTRQLLNQRGVTQEESSQWAAYVRGVPTEVRNHEKLQHSEPAKQEKEFLFHSFDQPVSERAAGGSVGVNLYEEQQKAEVHKRKYDDWYRTSTLRTEHLRIKTKSAVWRRNQLLNVAGEAPTATRRIAPLPRRTFSRGLLPGPAATVPTRSGGAMTALINTLPSTSSVSAQADPLLVGMISDQSLGATTTPRNSVSIPPSESTPSSPLSSPPSSPELEELDLVENFQKYSTESDAFSAFDSTESAKAENVDSAEFENDGTSKDNGKSVNDDYFVEEIEDSQDENYVAKTWPSYKGTVVSNENEGRL
jgi:hypothetical protein